MTIKTRTHSKTHLTKKLNLIEKGKQYTYRNRKEIKRINRSNSNVSLNVISRVEMNINFSTFINFLKKQSILIDKKALAQFINLTQQT